LAKKTLLFVCTGNAGRSQIAQALAEPLVPTDVEVVSAGVDPWPDLHPMARLLLAEKGIPMAGRRPRHVKSFAEAPIDWVVTIGDRARDETPRLGRNPIRMHWDLADPADADGSGREKAVFRATMAQIAERLPGLLALLGNVRHPADLDQAPGISTCVARPHRFEPGAHLPMFAAAGFRCIELDCFLGGRDFSWDMPSAVRELRRVADDTGVRIYAVHAAGGLGAMRDDCSERLSVDLYKTYADLAAELGAPVVSLHAGLVRGADRDLARAELRHSLEELARHVLPLPCRYAWENESPGLSVMEHLEWIRQLDPGAFGFVLDTGHSHLAGTTDAYLDACRGLLCSLHLHDNSGQKDEHRLPGTGSFPWDHFMPRLQRCGYVGPLLLEIEARDRQGELASVLSEARTAADFLQRAGRGQDR